MTTNRKKLVSIIVPCFNEEENLLPLYQNIVDVLDDEMNYEFILVDDGSQDGTLSLLKQMSINDSRVKYLSFSRNFGHQNAIKAGIDFAQGDCSITLDADLQHPPKLIPQLLQLWKQGYEVVYTTRDDSDANGFLKKLTSRLFYVFINKLSSTYIHQGSADFRLLDRKVMNELQKVTENYLFIRGLVAWMGFKQTSVSYQPNERFKGKSKYSFYKMARFAIIGITSFSIKPLRMSLYLGLVIALLSFIYGLYAVFVTLFTDKALVGWGSIIASILFIGGIQLVMLGVVGEYLGKLFIENKRRPNYIIREQNMTE
jgi:dolichol-phosphate mannosyltransferase